MGICTGLCMAIQVYYIGVDSDAYVHGKDPRDVIQLELIVVFGGELI